LFAGFVGGLLAGFAAAGILDRGVGRHGFGCHGVGFRGVGVGVWLRVGGRLGCGVECGGCGGALVGVLPAGGCAVGGVAAVEFGDQVGFCQLA
jgi:hypothetical protein